MRIDQKHEKIQSDNQDIKYGIVVPYTLEENYDPGKDIVEFEGELYKIICYNEYYSYKQKVLKVPDIFLAKIQIIREETSQKFRIIKIFSKKA